MKLQGPAVLVLASLGIIMSTSVRNGSLLASEMGSAPGESVKQRSRREQVCGSGQYKPEHSEECCTKCEAGTHLLEDCSHGKETKCHPCSDNEFMDGENHSLACHRCKQCQEESGQETKISCNKTHNTECKCRKNFFCLTSENCLKCRPCKECDVTTQWIAQRCAGNNDTVCAEKDVQSSNTGVVIGVVIGVMVGLIAIVTLLYFKRHLLPCNKSGDFQIVPQMPADANKQLQEVPDIELSAEDLNSIVAEIEPRKFHDLGLRLGLGEPKLQQIEADYYNDKSRQGYEILSSWLQGHGGKGAFPLLIATLNKAKCVHAAENILKIISPAEDTTERSKLGASENGTTMDSVSV